MGSSVVSDLAIHSDGEILIGDINEKSIDKAISKLRKKGSGSKRDKSGRCQ